MKIAALADIHSNHIALETCLDYIYNSDINGIAFLGDFITDCPYPQKTLQAIKSIPQKYKTWFIRGNREDYIINYHDNPDDGWKYSSRTGSLLYTYENLFNTDIEFFRSMPISMKIEINGYKPFTICHGTPDSSKELIMPNTEIPDKIIDNLETDLLLFGHNHKPFCHESNGKMLFNGGSVGIPCNHQTNAQFTVIEYQKDKWVPQQVSLKYDIMKAVSEFYESGLADKAFWWSRCVIKQLQSGRNYAVECISMAIKIAEQNCLSIDDESVWDKAAYELNLK